MALMETQYKPRVSATICFHYLFHCCEFCCAHDARGCIECLEVQQKNIYYSNTD